MTNASLKTRIALKLLKIEKNRLDRAWDSFIEDCEMDRAQGFRPHYCFHGTNLWTDYDPICGPCEDGLTTKEDHLLGCYHRALTKAEGWLQDMEATKNAYIILVRAGLEQTMDLDSAYDKIMERYGIPKTG